MRLTAATALALAAAAACTQVVDNTDLPFPPLEITTTVLPDGVVGQTYAASVGVFGGDFQYTFSIIDGGLPPGLAIGTTSGVITGTPTEAASTAFMVQVESGDGQAATRQFELLVLP